MINKRLILIVFITLNLFQDANSQHTQNELISAYIFNFANYIQWPPEANKEKFRIQVISYNQELIKELKKMASSKRLKGRQIEIETNFPKVSELDNIQMVFIDKEQQNLYRDLYKIIKGKPILAVSEQLENKVIAMINLYRTANNELDFELNKPNILAQNLQIGEEVLLLGGNEMDVIKIYLDAMDKLNSMENELSAYQHRLQILNNQISKSRNNIDYQNSLIKEQSKTIREQQEEYDKLKDEAATLMTQIETQQNLIDEGKKELAQVQSNLQNNQKVLSDQKEEIKAGEAILVKQQEEIKKKTDELATSVVTLDKRNQLIEQQQRAIVLFVFLSVIIVILAIILAMFLIRNRKQNRLLSLQKIVLNKKNKELYDTISQLEATQDQLVNSEKMASLGVLTAGIAHEINNPVNFVFNGVNNLREEFNYIKPVISEISKPVSNGSEALEHYQNLEKLRNECDFDESYDLIPQIIEDVIIGAERISEIVEGLKYFSRMDKLTFADIDIHKVLEGALVLLKNQYKNRIELIQNYQENLPFIAGNPGRINQVFLNIINNSIDAIEGEGEITLTTREVENGVEISIKDNGPGMGKEVLEHIFEPFYTTKQVGKGTGLGLSISYGIINDHNGKISVNSEPGKGSEFIVILPKQQKEANT